MVKEFDKKRLQNYEFQVNVIEQEEKKKFVMKAIM